jgi:16S rRNA (cytidine1402-2'-O)-methyltransferase
MGTLHIVATPIGNLEDVTLRALRVLREADHVLAEDTRRTRILLDHFEIAQKPTSLHAHNEAARIQGVIEALEEDRQIALVSDAGSPLVSDPGARLVAAVAAAGHRVEAVPGASALLAALCVAGLDTERVLFLGFLPRKAGARRKLLESQRGRSETLVLFESPRRVAKTLGEIAEILGDRAACLARELTKRHEEVSRDSASALARRCLETPPRGECTLVIAGADPEEGLAESTWDDERLDEAIRKEVIAGGSIRDLARDLAGRSGHARRDVYARAVSFRDAHRARTDSSTDENVDTGIDTGEVE